MVFFLFAPKFLLITRLYSVTFDKHLAILHLETSNLDIFANLHNRDKVI